MYIDHIAIYVNDLERMREFYENFFEARASGKYHNQATGLQTYFLTFADGCRVELMTRPEVNGQAKPAYGSGYIHLAVGVDTKEDVDALAGRLHGCGYDVESGPRTTGDGYYESCIIDPEGNRVEIVAGKKNE